MKTTNSKKYYKTNCPNCNEKHIWNTHDFKEKAFWVDKLIVCLCHDCLKEFGAIQIPSHNDHWHPLQTTITAEMKVRNL